MWHDSFFNCEYTTRSDRKEKSHGEQIVTWLILEMGLADYQLKKWCLTWLIHVWHDSLTWLIHMCDMTHSGNGLSWLSTACTRLIQTKENRIVGNKLWRDSFFNCEWPLADTQLSIVTWPIQEKNCDMTRSVNCDMTPVKKVVNRLIL